MGWPQVTVIALASCGVMLNGVKHGESKGKFNFGHAIVGVAIEMGLLYAGGFFS